MLTKTLEGAQGKHSTLIEVVDIDANPELAKQYNVRGVPTMIKVEDDKEIARKVGVCNEADLLKFLA